MIEETLAIFVITYNRAAALDRTLRQLHEGPFAGCSVTVLDNCSSDQTPAVCEAHRQRFSDFRVVRHRRNIGLCANYLRVVELSDRLYTWVLCDDDTLDFSDCGDVLRAVGSAKYDLVSLGAAAGALWNPGLATTADKLVADRQGYFLIGSFVPSLIFKTERFDSLCVAEGYRNAANLFPQFPFLAKTVREACTIYIAKGRIVHRNNEVNDFAHLHYLAAWIRSCDNIADRALRQRVLEELTGPAPGLSLWRRLLVWIAVDKIMHTTRFWRDLRSVAQALPLSFWPAFLAALPAAFVPIEVYRRLKLRRRRRMGRPSGEVGATSFDLLRQ